MLIEDLQLIVPEIVLASSICVLLLLESFLPSKVKKITYYFAILSVGLTLACVCLAGKAPVQIIFDKSYIIDNFSQMSKALVLIIACCILIYSKTYLLLTKIFISEFFVLLMLSLLGSIILISAGNFLTLYLGLELMALPLYAMIVLSKNNVKFNESSLKYFILGSLGSGMLLYGISLIYASTGSVGFEVLRNVSKLTFEFGMCFLLLGIFLELGAAPLHTWLPDVYEGSPTPVAMVITTIPKIALTVILCRLFTTIFNSSASSWQMILLVMGLFSIFLGSIVAIAQTNIKRMLAYSTITNIGFVLLALLTIPEYGSLPAMFYIVAYALTSLAIFACLTKLASNVCAFDNIEDLQGLAKSNPKIAFVLLLLMLSLAGIPPFIGFYAKLMILQALISMDYVLVAILAMIASVISVYYYFRIIKVMYFDDLQISHSLLTSKSLISNSVLYVNAILVLALGIMPVYLYNFCKLNIL
jgi:NADH-quinone oxidoreductase subunit N